MSRKHRNSPWCWHFQGIDPGQQPGFRVRCLIMHTRASQLEAFSHEMPSLLRRCAIFDKPLLSDKPERDQLSWRLADVRGADAVLFDNRRRRPLALKRRRAMSELSPLSGAYRSGANRVEVWV
jgi:hypothetical protein